MASRYPRHRGITYVIARLYRGLRQFTFIFPVLLEFSLEESEILYN